MSAFYDTHRKTLEDAVEATRTRGFFSACPEVPSGRIYGESARDDGEAAFKALLDAPFALEGHPANGALVGAEASPYGFALGVRYPAADPEALIAAASSAARTWARTDTETRLGVCLEALHRLNRDSFLMAKAVEHTTGQAFVMAFQAGGPHAQDRGLEAVAYAADAMARIPAHVVWEKPQGKNPPLVVDKTFAVAPRGVGLVIGCATFPTWNSYSALFANLATGNATIVKPHPMAILPLALTVRTLRAVLAEAGCDPDAVVLAADTPDAPVTMAYLESPAVAMIDFTGSSAFGAVVRQKAGARPVFTEEAGVNPVVIAGTDDFKGLCGNLAMSLALYSGQMCTAPQAIFVPEGGIETDAGHKSVEAVGEGIAAALDKLLGDPARAMAISGAIQNAATPGRIERAARAGRLVRASAPIPGAEPARTATPALVEVSAEDPVWREECFGPLAFIVRTEDAQTAVATAAAAVAERGAITALLHATDEALIEEAAGAFAAAGAPLSVNLTGGLLVNQSAAFSDYHVTALNPAGTATLADAAFVTRRFSVATVRRPRVN